MADMPEAATPRWNDRDRAGHRDCYAEDAEPVAPGLGGKGHEAVLDVRDEKVTAFPDHRVVVDRAVVQGDLLVEESRFLVHRDTLLGRLRLLDH